VSPLVIVIDLDPNVAQIGPFAITWHGIFGVVGILCAARIGQVLLGGCARQGVDASRIHDLAVWMVVGGLIGARLLFVWENYRLFVGAWPAVVLINEGGISQWGGIFGAMVAGYVWCRRSRIDWRRVLDVAGPAAAIGFAIGRIGDVINGEHHAIPSNLPWAVSYVNPQTLAVPGVPVHPEVAYELLWNLLVFAAALATWPRLKRALPDGATGLIWLGAFAVGRFFLSFLREDSLILGLRQAQWASLAMIVVAAGGVALLLRARGTGPATSGSETALARP
jgi:phosphatidylglycerol:prolipoprotein diacylglycerol transferase